MARPSKYNWEEIRVDLKLGIDKAIIHKKYNVPYNTISNHLKKHPIEINEQAIEALRSFEAVSEVISEVSEQEPEVAKKVIDIITEKHPEFKIAMVALSGAIFRRGMEVAKETDAQGLSALSKAMQTTTDTLGISQRHAPKQDINVSQQLNNETKILTINNLYDT